MKNIEISVVVPLFNEEEVVRETSRKLADALGQLTDSFEIIFVDDGSQDKTISIVNEILKDGSGNFKLIELSRNFGKESALAAGMEAALGEAVLFIDADMQHPIELIPQMVSLWRSGHEVVNAVKRTRGKESFVYRLFSSAFNQILSSSTNRDMVGASDYKLLDRQVVDVLKTFTEQHRFFRGLVAWVGFKSVDVQFDVAERYAGQSRWTSWSLILYSLRCLVGFTSLPLRLVAFTGFFTVTVGVILLLQTLANYFSGNAAIGFTTVIAVQILLGGMTIFSVGVVAIYLSYMHDESKRRPIFVVRRPSRR